MFARIVHRRTWAQKRVLEHIYTMHQNGRPKKLFRIPLPMEMMYQDDALNMFQIVYSSSQTSYLDSRRCLMRTSESVTRIMPDGSEVEDEDYHQRKLERLKEEQARKPPYDGILFRIHVIATGKIRIVCLGPLDSDLDQRSIEPLADMVRYIQNYYGWKNEEILLDHQPLSLLDCSLFACAKFFKTDQGEGWLKQPNKLINCFPSSVIYKLGEMNIFDRNDPSEDNRNQTLRV